MGAVRGLHWTVPLLWLAALVTLWWSPPGRFSRARWAVLPVSGQTVSRSPFARADRKTLDSGLQVLFGAYQPRLRGSGPPHAGPRLTLQPGQPIAFAFLFRGSGTRPLSADLAGARIMIRPLAGLKCTPDEAGPRVPPSQSLVQAFAELGGHGLSVYAGTPSSRPISSRFHRCSIGHIAGAGGPSPPGMIAIPITLRRDLQPRRDLHFTGYLCRGGKETAVGAVTVHVSAAHDPSPN